MLWRLRFYLHSPYLDWRSCFQNKPISHLFILKLVPTRIFLICFWVANDMFLIFISLGGMFLVLHTKSVFLRYTRKVSKISQKCNLTSAVCTYQRHSFNEYLFCSKNILEVYVVASGFTTYQKCIL